MAHILLAIILFGLSVRTGKSILNHYMQLEAWHRNLGLAGFLLVAPSCWLYGCVLFNKHFKLSLQHMVHFLPAVIFVLMSGFIPNHSNIPSYISYGLVLAHFFTYLAFCFSFKQPKLEALNTAFNLSWYKKIVWGLVLIGTYYLLIFLSVIPFYIGGAIFYSVLICTFFFIFMKRHQLLTDRYLSSNLSEKDLKLIYLKFKQQLIEKQSFLSPDFSLKIAAESIGSTSRQLSQAINHVTNQNFSKYINSHRVNYSKLLLSDRKNKNSKLAIIGLECGFGNTTSFNQAFKIQTGMTPSEYKVLSFKES